VTYVTTVAAIALFTAGLWVFGVVAVAMRIVAISRSAAEVMRNREVDDDFKEREIQRASLALLRDFFSILVRSVGVLALSLLPLLAFHFAGLVPLGTSLDALASWDAIVIATAVMCVAFFLRRKRH
jgi:hypothetical protein